MKTNSERLVLIDDNPDHIGRIVETLSHDDHYEVRPISSSGKSNAVIVDQIARMDPSPVAILLDVFRGRPSGGESDPTFLSLLTAIRERFRGRIPVIALTGRIQDASVNLVIDWYRNGVDAWI